MKIYMEVTQDDLALPVMFAESGRELARMLGLKGASVHAYIRNAKVFGWKYPKYIIVEIDEEGTEEDGSEKVR